MASIILVIHIMLAVFITILVLLQRSEGGALGGLGGMGANSLFTGRQAANALSKATGWFFVCFICTSLALVILAKGQSVPQVLDLTQPVSSPAADVVDLNK